MSFEAASVDLTKKEEFNRKLGFIKLVSYIFLSFGLITYLLLSMFFFNYKIFLCFYLVYLISIRKRSTNYSLKKQISSLFFNKLYQDLFNQIQLDFGEQNSVNKNVEISGVTHQLKIRNNMVEGFYLNDKLHNESGNLALITEHKKLNYGLTETKGYNYFNGKLI